MYKVTWVLVGQAPTLKCPFFQFSEVSLQSVRVAGIGYFWKSGCFYLKDISGTLNPLAKIP